MPNAMQPVRRFAGAPHMHWWINNRN
jgi:hypothetical protein